MVSGDDVEQLIVGGKPAKEKEIPFQCSLEVTFNEQWYFLCGAVVYNQFTLITAAHCIDAFS